VSTASQVREVGEAAGLAKTSMDLTGEADYDSSDKADLPEYRFAAIKAEALLAAQGDARRQRELITTQDVTIGRNLHASRVRLRPHVNRAPRGTQFDP
jgi:hypothetical protein